MSLSGYYKSNGDNAGFAKRVHSHYDTYGEWPREGGFTAGVLDGDYGPGLFTRLRDDGIIESVGQVRPPSHTTDGNRVHVWTFTDRTLEILAEYEDDRPMEMPCGHAGFENTGEYLKCKTCNGRFTAEEVKNND
jgi:hypothetical protein